MPELPDVEVFRRYLHSRAINGKLTKVETMRLTLFEIGAMKSLSAR